MATKQQEMTPLVGALSITASMFVAGTSIFVAIVAFVAAAHQLDATGLANSQRSPSAAGRWWAVALGVTVLVNGLVAGARARKSATVALVTSAAFVLLTIATSWLYVDTW